MTALVVDDLTLSYGRRVALDGVSFNCDAFPLAILGPNGAGKSTLLSVLTTRMRAKGGTFSLPGVDQASRSRDVRARIGWLPQDVLPVPGLRVREQVAFFGWLMGMSQPAAWRASEGALDAVGLLDRARQSAARLSGGQRRRLGIAQSIVHAPGVLFMDEPTAGLDPDQRAGLRELITDLAQDVPTVITTHQVDDLHDVFRSVVVIADGRVVFSGTVDHFLDLAPTDAPAGRRAEAAYRQVLVAHSPR